MKRITLILILAVVFLGVGTAYAGPGWLSFHAVLWSDGLISLVWLLAATMLGAVILRPLGAARDVLGIASCAALGLGLMSLGALGLGLAGWLNLWTTVALLLAGPAMLVADLFRRHGNAALESPLASLEAWLNGPAEAWGAWLAVAALAAIAAVAAAVPPGFLWPGDPLGYDVLEYHLQVPREWYELGGIVPLHHNAFSFFPFNVELQYLMAMYLKGGPWAGMYLAQYLTGGFMALAAMGVYGSVAAAAKSSRPGRAAAVAAASMVAVPWIPMLGSVAYDEAGLLLYGTLAIGWTLRAMTAGEHRIRDMAIAGAMAGLACGVKYTAVPMVLIAVPLALVLVAIVWRGRGPMLSWRQTAIGCVIYVVGGMICFAPWLIRNQSWAGNPVFPEAMSLLGHGPFSNVQVQRWDRAHTPRHDEVENQRPLRARLAAFGKTVVLDRRYGYLFWPLAICGAVAGWRRPRTWFLVGLMLALAVFWLGFTHLQSRFFVLGVPIGAMLIGDLAAERRGAAIAGCGLAMLTGACWVGLHLAGYPQISKIAAGGLFGFEDLSQFVGADSPDLVRLIESDDRIALVGDAKAFVYSMPMRRLRYRTVFDVDGRPGSSPLDAWLGPDASEIRDTHYIVLDTLELKRFSDTYLAVPLPAEAVSDQRIVILPPQRASRP